MEYLLDESWNNIDSFIPFGFGRVGKRVLPKLQEMFQVPFVIDNNPLYEGEKNGFSIKGLDDGLAERNNEKIVVLTVETAYVEIRKLLIGKGLEEYKDFCILERFFGEWFLKNRGECYLSKIDTVITSKCSLACKHCAMFIPYCKNKEDYSLDVLKNNFDLFFELVDYVLEYTLLGGEPILHKDIKEILRYLHENYGNRIGKIVLISNGKAILQDDLLEVMKTCNVIVSISDYTEVHDYKGIINSFVEKLDAYEIPYYYNYEMEWKDHGYPVNPSAFSDENGAKHMRMCGHTAHSMNEGRLYYCDPMYGAEKNTGFQTCKDDCLHFNDLLNEEEKIDAKKRIISYCFGKVNEKGFPSFCKVCAGIGHDNSSVIRAGE